MADITIYESSELPEVAIRFTDAAGNPAPFGAGDSARFYMRSTGRDNGSAVPMAVDGAEMSFVGDDRENGIARWFPSEDDFAALPPGHYYAVAGATVGGKLWREPREGWLLCEVVPMLAPLEEVADNA